MVYMSKGHWMRPDTIDPQIVTAPDISAQPTDRERIDLLRWHLDRFDRARGFTVSRAAATVSAGAILSAGNAVILAQLLGNSLAGIHGWLLFSFSVAIAASASLTILVLVRATGALITARGFRETFRHDGVPPGLLFNGSDTVEHFKSFQNFRDVVESQNYQEILKAAQVEFWIVVHQHRCLYEKQRWAVRMLGWAAITFLLILIALVTTALVLRF
jgi:hypothetical protein